MVWVCLLAAGVTAHARPGLRLYQPRRPYVRRAVPRYPVRRQQPVQTPLPAVAQPPATFAQLFEPVVAAPPPAPTEADLAKAAADKAAADQRLLAFQRKRAEGGSASAQYELGVRYLTGKGVEVSPSEARKWLAASAKQDYSAAQRKLKDLDAGSPSESSEAAVPSTVAKPATTPSL